MEDLRGVTAVVEVIELRGCLTQPTAGALLDERQNPCKCWCRSGRASVASEVETSIRLEGAVVRQTGAVVRRIVAHQPGRIVETIAGHQGDVGQIAYSVCGHTRS